MAAPTPEDVIVVKGRVELGVPDKHVWAGKVSEFCGMRVYSAMPPHGAAVLGVAVVVSDIWGIDLPYARLWTDKIAEAGYIALLPDFLHGRVWPYPTLDETNWEELEGWVESHSMSSVIRDVNLVVDVVRRLHGQSAVAVVGFCWGGAVAQEVACTSTLPSTGPVQAVCIIHGCYLRMHLNAKRLRRSAAYFCGGDDGATPPEKREMVCQAFSRSSAPHNRMSVYEGQSHFFALPRATRRCDSFVRQATQRCFEDVVAYLDDALGGALVPSSAQQAMATATPSSCGIRPGGGDTGVLTGAVAAPNTSGHPPTTQSALELELDALSVPVSTASPRADVAH